jgi:hypothetical protein
MTRASSSTCCRYAVPSASQALPSLGASEGKIQQRDRRDPHRIGPSERARLRIIRVQPRGILEVRHRQLCVFDSRYSMPRNS